MKRPEDTEDKAAWCAWGEEQELLFLSQQWRFFDGREPFSENPDKLHDKRAIDFVYRDGLADLKCQDTPFFMARKHYDVDPQFAASFNDKDLEHYAGARPIVIFWLRWKDKLEGYGIRVRPMEGVFILDYEELDVAAAETVPHVYERRRNDMLGNGKASYVINVKEHAKWAWIDWKGEEYA